MQGEGFDSIWDEQGAESSGSQQSPQLAENQDTHDRTAEAISRANTAGDAIYFRCTITDPQKEQDNQSAYVTYAIHTETNSPSFLHPTAKVRRRFSDFVYLYESLCNEFQASAIPSLPDKSRLEYLKGDRFKSDFTLKRAASLTRFLNRIGQHPFLKKSRIYHTFLESEEWNTFKKHKGGSRLSVSSGSGSSPNGSYTGSSVLEGLSDTFLNAFAKVNNPSRELTEVKEKADKLDDNLSGIEKTFGRVVRRQSDLASDLEEFGEQIDRLSSCEPELTKELTEFAGGVKDMSQSFHTLREQVENDYVSSLRDMEAYLSSLKSLIKLRQQKQLDYEALSDYLVKAKNDRDVLMSGGGSNFLRNKVEDFRGVNHEQSRKERLHKLELKIDELERESISAKKTSDSFEEFVLNEVKIFQKIKYREMKETLDHLADYNIQFYKRIIDGWQDISRDLDH